MFPEDTLVRIVVKNTSERIITQPERQVLFNWSIYIETELESFRKEIEKVIYHLHLTFPNKDVTIISESHGFKLNAQGWGEFTIRLEIILKDGRRVELSHYLSLFSEEKKKETTKTMYKMDFS